MEDSFIVILDNLNNELDEATADMRARSAEMRSMLESFDKKKKELDLKRVEFAEMLADPRFQTDHIRTCRWIIANPQADKTVDEWFALCIVLHSQITRATFDVCIMLCKGLG